MYQPRIIDTILRSNFDILPAILIEGAKAVGKTETCRQIANTIFDMDNPVTHGLLAGNPDIILSSPKPVLIDEWQLAPELWAYVRRQVDRGLSDGSILLTGSSIKVNSRIHSGAGRIIRMKMRPFSVEERQMTDAFCRISEMLEQKANYQATGATDVTTADYLEEIYRSGFPGIRQRQPQARKQLLASYVENIVEHELEENGFSIKSKDALRSWMKAYAAAIGTTTSAKTILETTAAMDGDAPSWPTAINYREVLETLSIIDEVQPFLAIGKLNKNLAKAPKHFLLDPAIALTLLAIDRSQLENYQIPKTIGKLNVTILGQLLESLVYQSLVVYADALDASLTHFRNHKGTQEIDFIIQKGTTLLLFEVKARPSVKESDVKSLNWFEETVQDEFDVVKVLLNTGPYAYTRQQDNVHVVPIAMLGV